MSERFFDNEIDNSRDWQDPRKDKNNWENNFDDMDSGDWEDHFSRPEHPWNGEDGEEWY